MVKNKMVGKITENTTLGKILEIPGAVEILAKYNLPCLFCPFAEIELENLKIGDVCKMYGINLEKLLKDLNKDYGKKGTKAKKGK